MGMLAPQEIVIRLAAAALLGALVGLERERLEWAAGLRTHMLVCVGSALVMLVSMHGFADVQGGPHVVLDPSRVAAQVVSGIGFLGAGTILLLRQEVIRGLTTAASQWTIAAVGLAVGGGLYLAATATTVCALVILALVKPLEQRLFRRPQRRQLTVIVAHGTASLTEIESVVDRLGVPVVEFTVRRSEGGEHDAVHVAFVRSVPKPDLLQVMDALRAVEGVREIRG